MQEGMTADIVVFDPETVREGSTYKASENGLPPIGLPHVIVNGVFVKKDHKATDQFPGLPVRYPVEDKGRHVPASQAQWKQDFLIDSSSIAPQASLKSFSPMAPASHDPLDLAISASGERQILPRQTNRMRKAIKILRIAEAQGSDTATA